MTRVLPLPAPARMSTGPSVVSTASRCCGLSFSRNDKREAAPVVMVQFYRMGAPRSVGMKCIERQGVAALYPRAHEMPKTNPQAVGAISEVKGIESCAVEKFRAAKSQVSQFFLQG